MKKSYGELQGAGYREGVLRGKARRGPGEGPGTVLPLHSGELLRNLPEEDFSSKLTVPVYGKHGSSIAHVNSPWISRLSQSFSDPPPLNFFKSVPIIS